MGARVKFSHHGASYILLVVKQPSSQISLLHIPRGLFLESPDNVLCPKSCFLLLCLHSRSKYRFNNFENDAVKLSISEQNLPVCELGTVLIFNRF